MTSKKVALALQQNENFSIKTRFAHRFIVTLSRMRNRFGPTANEEIRRRSNRIKIAAYSSMARAVGSRKAWSRAFLFNIRNRTRLQGILRNRCLTSKNKRVMKIKVREKNMSKVDTLRKLVPGGAAMDICGFLEETAHYIKCLATQVKVMQSIADRYSK